MYIIEISVIKIIYRKPFKNIIFEFFLVVLLEISLELIIYSIINKFVYNYTYRAFIIELIILVSIIVFSKVNALNKNLTFEKINSNILIYFISICSIYVMVFKVLWSYDNTIVVNNLLITIVIFITLVISQIFIYLYVTKIIKEKEALKVSNEYNEVINEIVQEIRQRQHDFVNYKNTIRGIVEVVDDKDVKAAINNYIKDEDIHDNKINELIYIEHVVIRSIIYRNLCKAKKSQVNFKYKIENNVLDHILTYHEISNILNNLLNNAFDEVLKDECVKKDIEIKIFNEKETSHLIVKNQIVNPNDINLNEMFTRGYSTKNTTGTRGYGLYNVQKIVNLHKGYVKIDVECGKIIFDIYFNNSSG
jgi:two-component system sensor histidine kinase AgrC